MIPSYAVEPGVRRGRASFRVVRETSEERFRWFNSHREAFEAAGLDPHDAG